MCEKGAKVRVPQTDFKSQFQRQSWASHSLGLNFLICLMSTSILACLGAMKLEEMQGDGSLWFQDQNINPQVSVGCSGAKAEGTDLLSRPPILQSQASRRLGS